MVNIFDEKYFLLNLLCFHQEIQPGQNNQGTKSSTNPIQEDEDATSSVNQFQEDGMLKTLANKGKKRKLIIQDSPQISSMNKPRNPNKHELRTLNN